MKHIVENARDYYSLGVEVMKNDEDLMGAIDYEKAEDIGHDFHEEHNGWFEDGNYVWYDVCTCLELNPHMIKPALELFTPEEIKKDGNFVLLEDVNNYYELGKWVIFNSDAITDSWILRYIDYEQVGYDTSLDYDGGFTSKGFMYVY